MDNEARGNGTPANEEATPMNETVPDAPGVVSGDLEKNGGGDGQGDKGTAPVSRKQQLLDQVDRAKEMMSEPVTRTIVILSICLIILLIVILGLTIALATRSDPEPEQICLTADCLRAASLVTSSVANVSVNPCTDFYDFACHGWIRDNEIPDSQGSWSVVNTLEEEVLRDIRHFVDLVPQVIQDSDPSWKVAKFYKTCMNLDDAEYAPELLKQDIGRVSGWPILKNFNVQRFEVKRVIQRLQVEFGVSPYFEISVDTDDFAPAASVIKIEPSGLGLPDREYYFNNKYQKQREAYFTLMRETAKLMGGADPESNQFAEHVLSYEKRLAYITPTRAERRSVDYFQRLPVRKLVQVAPLIPWIDILQSYFPSSKIKENTYVMIGGLNYMSNVSSIIGSSDPLSLNNYLVWQWLRTYIPYVSRDYRSIATEFDRALNGVDISVFRRPEQRWKFCVKTVSKLMDLAVGSMYVKNRFETQMSQHVSASKLVDTLTSTVLDELDQLPWLSKSDQLTRAKEKVRTISAMTVVGFPEIVLNSNLLTSYYDELALESSFYTNLKKSFEFGRKKVENRLLNPHKSLKSWNHLAPQSVSAVFAHSGNRLLVGSGLIRSPIFDQTHPAALNFGAFGFSVGAQIMNAFGLRGANYNQLGALDPAINSDEHYNEDLNSTATCLLDDLIHSSVIDTDITIDPYSVLDQTLADITALKFVYMAYKSYSAIHGSQARLPGHVVKNMDQLFFLSFAQSMCENVRHGYEAAKYDLMDVLPSRLRVEKALEHSPEFARAFSCPRKGSKCIW